MEIVEDEDDFDGLMLGRGEGNGIRREGVVGINLEVWKFME